MTTKELYQRFKNEWQTWPKNSEYKISPSGYILIGESGNIYLSSSMDVGQKECSLFFQNGFNLDEENCMLVVKDFLAVKYAN